MTSPPLSPPEVPLEGTKSSSLVQSDSMVALHRETSPLAHQSWTNLTTVVGGAMSDSLHCISSDEPSTDSRMCTTEESAGLGYGCLGSNDGGWGAGPGLGGACAAACNAPNYAEKMTSSTEGMISLSEDSSGRDTFAQAHAYPWDGGGGSGRRAIHEDKNIPERDGALEGCSLAARGGGSDTVDLDDSDDHMNGMLGSYREISMQEEVVAAGVVARDSTRGGLAPGEDTEEEVSNLTADSSASSLGDEDSEGYDDEQGEEDEEEEEEEDEEEEGFTAAVGPRPRTLRLRESSMTRRSKLKVRRLAARREHQGSAAQLTELPGVVYKDGEMVAFVADDLHEKIKMASPVAKKSEGSSFPGSRSSTPSIHRRTMTPQLINPGALSELEANARKLAAGVDTMLENLTGTLHSISSLTVDCLESYRDSVCKTCDAMDGNIKCMYQLMAKCEELSNSMKSVERLSEQVKEMKRLLDLFEQAANAGTS